MTLPGVDLTRPNLARVVDYLLGGCSNFQPDRDEAGQMLRICPQLPDMTRVSRVFAGRAVTWAARQGVTQFIDLGAGEPLHRGRGKPPARELHELAQAATPGARVFYVDNDPIVVLHSEVMRAATLRAGQVVKVSGVAVLEADLREPETVLASPELLEVINPAEPVCVFLGLVPSLMPAGQVREVVAGYAALAAPGSVIALSCWRFADSDLYGQVAAACTSAALYNHSGDDVAAILGGLDLIPPGITPAGGLRPGEPPGVLALAPGRAEVLAAVARKC